MSALISPVLLEPALGASIVILDASRRFDLPSSIREYTTAQRYGIGAGGYVLMSLLLYVALYLACLKPPLPGAAYLSLALSLALWRLPIVSTFDATLRQSMRRVAGAPFEARRLATMLTAERFRPSPALEREVRTILQLRGYDADDDWLPAAAPVRRLWLHAAMCFFALRDWERDDGGYRAFMDGSGRQDFEILRQRFDQLSCQVVRVLATVEKLADLWSEEGAATDDGARGQARRDRDKRAVVTELVSDLREDIEFFSATLSIFIARGVLAASLTEGQRRKRLRSMGFVIEPLAPSFTVILFWTGVFYFAAFIVVGLLGGGRSLDRFEDLLRFFVLAATQTMAVAVAIVPKRLFGFANEDLYGNTPWRFVVGAGCAAVALAVVLRALLIPDFIGTLPTPRSLWLLSPFCTAATTAWLVQDSRWSRVESETGRRLLDALALMLAVGGAIAAVRVLRFALFELPWSPSRLPLDVGLALAVGIVIGYNVPSKFRNRVVQDDATPAVATNRQGLLGLLRAHAALGPDR